MKDTLYVKELSKSDLNRRLRKGKKVVGKFLSKGTMSKFVPLDENLPDRTRIAIFSKAHRGDPYVVDRGTWHQPLQGVL